jgi:ABC-type dipeptide/oligopeptide/nickel transport system permease component
MTSPDDRSKLDVNTVLVVASIGMVLAFLCGMLLGLLVNVEKGNWKKNSTSIPFLKEKP